MPGCFDKSWIQSHPSAPDGPRSYPILVPLFLDVQGILLIFLQDIGIKHTPLLKLPSVGLSLFNQRDKPKLQHTCHSEYLVSYDTNPFIKSEHSVTVGREVIY